ncbi:MAG TPA: tetratricopeptide repeat protein [Phycisphaerae bacterium]|nr:tetratricopeptide repeat protein [Phycisphaerae bacterium]
MLTRLLILAFFAVIAADNGDESGHASVESLYQRVESLLAEEKPAQADEVADRIVRSNPRSAITHRKLADLFEKHAQRESAIKHLRQALAYDPTPEDHFHIGRLLVAEGRHTMALEHLEQANDLGFNDPQLHAELGLAYARIGRDFGHVRTIDLATGEPGQATDEWYLIKRSGVVLGTFEAAPRSSAVYQLELALSEGVKRLDVSTELAEVWMRRGEYNRAQAICLQIKNQLDDEKIAPSTRADGYLVYAKAVYGLDDMERYIALVRQAAKLDPTRSDAWLAPAYRQAADRYKQRGDLPHYTQYLKDFLAERPDDAEGHYDLAIAYLEAGERDLAAQHLQASLDAPGGHSRRNQILELLNSIHSN